MFEDDDADFGAEGDSLFQSCQARPPPSNTGSGFLAPTSRPVLRPSELTDPDRCSNEVTSLLSQASNRTHHLPARENTLAPQCRDWPAVLPAPALALSRPSENPAPASAPAPVPSPGSAPAQAPAPNGPVRLFPGPAGLLEKLAPGRHERAEGEASTDLSPQQAEEWEADLPFDICPAWRAALRELGPVCPVETFNTAWIKHSSCPAGTNTKRMPFLISKIVRLDLSCRDASVTLADQAGKVEGSIHREAVEKYGEELAVGSVLVLHRVGILVTSRAPHINITQHNLVSIYSTSHTKYFKSVSKEEMQFASQELERLRQQQIRSIYETGPDLPPAPNAPRGVPSSASWAPPTSFSPHLGSNSISGTLLPASGPGREPEPAPAHQPQPPPPPPPPSLGCVWGPAPVPTPTSGQVTSTTKFQFRSRPLQTPDIPSNTRTPTHSQLQTRTPAQSQRQTPAQSQLLVSSLMSDLDTSDIWSDF